MIYEVLGVIGVILVLGAFFTLVSERMRESDPAYLGLNILGSALILVSLAHHFNLAATIMQAAWIAITLVGTLFRRRSNRQ
ncbi:MAG: CBU_0592 family membrane protein [Gammaproteobacteria bacterium]